MKIDSPSGPATLRTMLQERTWSRRAAGWDHSSMPGMEKIATAVMTYAGDVDGRDVVDLGCGSGQLTLRLAERARSVVAVDFSAEMLDLLRERAEASGLDNVEGVRSSLQALDLPARSVDVVVTNYALHHLRHPEKAALVRRMVTWLRPGGLLVIGDMMFGLGSDADSRQIIAGKVRSIARRGPAGWWRILKNGWKLVVSREECPAPIEMWERMLREAGFESVRSERVVAEAAVVAGRAGLRGTASDELARTAYK
ncbi:MAG TPA: class I SAM-dependent methyltransferase [Acidimicrobiales bacterium]|nr:class I SAM-dependent methyltransferase [Acidimicrobiales bacterium]